MERLPSRLTPRLRRLRRSIYVCLRCRQGDRKLLPPLRPHSRRQRDLSSTRMDDMPRSTLPATACTRNCNNLHHTCHQHRTQHRRQQQTTLRLPVGIQRRPDGSRTQHAVETLNRKTDGGPRRLLHHRERHHSHRVPRTARQTCGCRADQRLRRRLRA